MKNLNLVSKIFFAGRILCSPLEALFTLLIFIANAELNASLLQLTIIAIIKPTTSLVAYYVNANFLKHGCRARSYLISLNMLGALPCLLFPFVNNTWFFIASYALFMATRRASYPIWAEVLKINFPLQSISNIVSKGISINYTVIIFIPLILSFWMDLDHAIWKFLFVLLGLFQILYSVILLRLETIFQASEQYEGGYSALIAPIIKSWQLLRKQPEFAKYLMLFFCGGVGIVTLQPMLPIFFKESLNLSYKELTFAFSCCKGVAFLATAPLWAHWVNRVSLYLFNGCINLCSCLFMLALLFSQISVSLVFFAYLIYGVMQAGCELSWNLSGPIFARENESTSHSGLNLALVGVRGCICPLLGQLIFWHSNASVVLIFALGICLFALVYALWLDHSLKSTHTVVKDLST